MRLQVITLTGLLQDLHGMLDAAKYADLVLLLIDGGFGFEMETFEFLNILQVRGVLIAHLLNVDSGGIVPVVVVMPFAMYSSESAIIQSKLWHQGASCQRVFREVLPTTCLQDQKRSTTSMMVSHFFLWASWADSLQHGLAAALHGQLIRSSTRA